MSINADNIKIQMLNEYESQVNFIFNKYYENKINLEEYKENMTWLKDVWNLTRVDIKNMGQESNKVKLLNNENLYVSYPGWFHDDHGEGCVIEYENRDIDINFECANDGNIELIIRGKDFRNLDNIRKPVYMNYTKLTINDRVIYNHDNLIWHNDSYIFNKECFDKENINIKLESKSIYDYFPKLKQEIETIIDGISDLKIAQNQISRYIQHEKMLLNVNKVVSNDMFLSNDEDDSILYNAINNSINLYSIYKQNKELKQELREYKQQTDKILDSYNTLFNSFLVYNRIEPKKLVKDSRELNMLLLDFIDNVCKKYNLQWWLHAGTLLGAIRHEGFIPWDDDCDINMIREDYEKFLNVIDKEIDEHGLTNTVEVNTSTITNNNVYLPFIKVNYWIGKDLYAFIDIFPTDYTDKVLDNLKELFQEENRRIGIDLRNGKNREEVLNKAFDRLNISKEKTDTIISGVEDPVLSIHSYDSIFPLKMMKFENRNYPCPNKHEDYIISEYGYGYKRIPKVIYNHGFYEYISGHENVYENFENEINKLKEINDKF